VLHPTGLDAETVVPYSLRVWKDRPREARHVTNTQILLLITPIVIVELILIVIALRDLLRPERRVRGDSKLLWGIVIVFISLLGPIIYLAAGRREEA
jgi:hypothetical protein